MIISKYVIKNVQKIILEEWSNSAWNVVDGGKMIIRNLKLFHKRADFFHFFPSVVFQIIVLAYRVLLRKYFVVLLRKS